MKKLLIACMSLVLLFAGCGKKQKEDPAVTPDTRESALITQIDFTQADAERLAEKAVSAHCEKTACKVTSVRISGADIMIGYTYTVNGSEKSGDAVLHSVSVSPNDKTVYSAQREEYRDSIPDIDDEAKEDEGRDDSAKEPEDESKDGEKEDKDKKKGDYDLPDHVDESDEDARNDQKVYDESGVQIWRIYTNKGRIEFSGTYSGDSKFNIQIMDLKQNVKGEPVDMKKAGEIEGSMKLDQGYYYVRIEAQGGWELYWNRIFE